MRVGGGGGGEWGQCINKLVLRELEVVLGGGGGHVNKSSIANLKCLKFNCISTFYFYF